ncbi:hypothetical protein BP5796_10411 [Coleophoma crateriformis]|uniref:DUF676 domain-containing protein n=1 Tax=Coleophoma crateriformis TaxID=565419 RepID=A0A3D8QQ29_9HELO|nr:hypothetical protein BP5796_10411 [Coleophoma crateriformis]
MGRTLLLAFIHGFKHLKGLVQESLKEDQVVTAVYPKFETKGDLAQCTANFTEWLKERVMELRKERCETPWPPKDNSVGVILVAHSMGGLIASDALFSVLDDKREHAHEHIFPLIHGILAFDTPYNGLARSMFVYGAFSNYQKVSSVWNAMSAVSAGLYSVAIPRVVASRAATSSVSTVAPSSKWKNWQLLAVRSGTVGAIAAGGVTAYIHREEIMNGVRNLNRDSLKKGASQAASQGYDAFGNGLAYINKDNIGQSFEWLSTHLQFVGALMRQKEMNHRLERLAGLKGLGVKNIYVSLGENGYWTGGYFVPERTFCAVPDKEPANAIFTRVVNPDAKDEVVGHTTIFNSNLNPGFDHMSTMSRDTIVEWFKDESEVIDTIPVPLSKDEEKVTVTAKELESAVEGSEKSSETDNAPDSEDDSPLDIAATAAAVPLPEDLEDSTNATDRQKYLQNLLRIAQSAGSGVLSTGWTAGSGVANAGWTAGSSVASTSWNLGSSVGSLIPKRGDSSLTADSTKSTTEEPTTETNKETKEPEVKQAKNGWGVKSLLGKYGGSKTEAEPAKEETAKADPVTEEVSANAASSESNPTTEAQSTSEDASKVPESEISESTEPAATGAESTSKASEDQPSEVPESSAPAEATKPAEVPLPAEDDVKIAVKDT